MLLPAAELSFPVRKNVWNVFQARRGGYEVERLLSVVPDEAKNLPKASVIS